MSIWGQSSETETYDEDGLDAMMTAEETELTFLDEMKEDWEALLRSPVRINEKDPMELSRLFFLDHEQINSLFQYLLLQGPMLSVYELLAVDGIDSQTARRISKVVTLETGIPMPWSSAELTGMKLRQELKMNVVSRPVASPGNAGTGSLAGIASYLSPLRLRLRYACRAGNGLELAIAGEKEAAMQPTLFYSGYLAYRGRGFVKRIVLGDFQLSFGQGLWIWNAFLRQSLSGSVAGWIMTSRGLNPVARSSAGPFFRGTAGWFQYRHFFFIPFLSMAGNASQSLNPETLAGVYAAYRGESMELGSGLLRYSQPPDTGAGIPHDVAQRLGRQARSKLGLDFKFRQSGLLVYGEAGLPLHRPAQRMLLCGLEWKAFAMAGFSLQLYDFPGVMENDDHQSVFGGEDRQNSRGASLGMNFRTGDKMQWTTGITLAESRLPKTNLDAPGTASLGSLALNYAGWNNLSMNVRLRYKEWSGNGPKADVATNVLMLRERYDVQLAFKTGIPIPYEAKLLFVTDHGLQEPWKSGWLLHQQISTDIIDNEVGLSLSYSLFDTDSWDERIYLNNSVSSFSSGFQALSGQGSKTGLNIRWTLRKRFDFSVFFTRLRYFDRGSMGSGTETTPGNSRNDAGFQMTLKW